jgi:hypothetical protein
VTPPQPQVDVFLTPENAQKVFDAARECYERWRTTPNRDAYVGVEFERAARGAVAAVSADLIAAGRAQATAELEVSGSILCDCSDADAPPTNPQTGAPMDHHCDCRAVEAAATVLGAYSLTTHARQCGHGVEMDEASENHASGKPTTSDNDPPTTLVEEHP